MRRSLRMGGLTVGLALGVAACWEFTGVVITRIYNAALPEPANENAFAISKDNQALLFGGDTRLRAGNPASNGLTSALTPQGIKAGVIAQDRTLPHGFLVSSGVAGDTRIFRMLVDPATGQISQWGGAYRIKSGNPLSTAVYRLCDIAMEEDGTTYFAVLEDHSAPGDPPWLSRHIYRGWMEDPEVFPGNNLFITVSGPASHYGDDCNWRIAVDTFVSPPAFYEYDATQRWAYLDGWPGEPTGYHLPNSQSVFYREVHHQDIKRVRDLVAAGGTVAVAYTTNSGGHWIELYDVDPTNFFLYSSKGYLDHSTVGLAVGDVFPDFRLWTLTNTGDGTYKARGHEVTPTQ